MKHEKIRQFAYHIKSEYKAREVKDAIGSAFCCNGRLMRRGKEVVSDLKRTLRGVKGSRPKRLSLIRCFCLRSSFAHNNSSSKILLLIVRCACEAHFSWGTVSLCSRRHQCFDSLLCGLHWRVVFASTCAPPSTLFKSLVSFALLFWDT